jgi:hypothetical protein
VPDHTLRRIGRADSLVASDRRQSWKLVPIRMYWFTPRFGNVKRLAGRDSCFEVLAWGCRSAPRAAINARLSGRLQPLLVLCYPAAEYCHGESSLDAPRLLRSYRGPSTTRAREKQTVTNETTTSKIETNKRRRAKNLVPSARLCSRHYCCLGDSISSPVPWPACTLGSWPFHLST